MGFILLWVRNSSINSDTSSRWEAHIFHKDVLGKARAWVPSTLRQSSGLESRQCIRKAWSLLQCVIITAAWGTEVTKERVLEQCWETSPRVTWELETCHHHLPWRHAAALQSKSAPILPFVAAQTPFTFPNDRKKYHNYTFEILTWIKAAGQGWQPRALILLYSPRFLHQLTSKETVLIYTEVGTSPWTSSFQRVKPKCSRSPCVNSSAFLLNHVFGESTLAASKTAVSHELFPKASTGVF